MIDKLSESGLIHFLNAAAFIRRRYGNYYLIPLLDAENHLSVNNYGQLCVNKASSQNIILVSYY